MNNINIIYICIIIYILVFFYFLSKYILNHDNMDYLKDLMDFMLMSIILLYLLQFIFYLMNSSIPINIRKIEYY
jgi:hypothetical protein